MNRAGPRLVVLLAGLGLMCTYFWLNLNKPLMATAALVQDYKGHPSSSWALGLDKQVLISRRLPPTGVFDGAGSHQINIEPVAPALYDRIRAHRDRVTQVYDDKALPSRLVAMKDFLVTQIADRRVYIVRENDAATIAGIVWNERRQIQDVFHCRDASLCPHLRLRYGRGWGHLVGPFLKTDIDPNRRGLPRGRWSTGPATEVAIDSDVPLRAILDLKLLRLASDQAIALNGQILRPVQTKSVLVAGGHRFYPSWYRIPVTLAKGRNNIRLSYSKWIKRREPQLAGFVYEIGLSRAPSATAQPTLSGKARP